MPESLLIDLCDPTQPEDENGNVTVRSLAKAYVSNNSCIKQHHILIQKQIEFKRNTEKLYGSGER
ncbi:hypothetical protein D3C85_801320 [compost metagenome]